MKKLLFALLLVSGAASIVRAVPTPFSDNVNTMWLNGDKIGVLAIANQHLQANPNDLAGLVITMEFQFEFSDISNVKATIDKVIAAGNGIKTKNFTALYPKLKSDLLYIEANVLPNVTAQMAQSEAAKGNIAGKPMDFLYVLQALESDGLTR